MNSQIEEIKKLYAKSRTFKIPKIAKEGEPQAVISIKPLGLDDLQLMNATDDMSLADTAKNAKIMFSKSMDVSEDDVSQISVEYLEDILEAITEVNNFKEADLKKTGIKEFVKNKRDQIESKKDAGTTTNS